MSIAGDGVRPYRGLVMVQDVARLFLSPAIIDESVRPCHRLVIVVDSVRSFLRPSVPNGTTAAPSLNEAPLMTTPALPLTTNGQQYRCAIFPQ